jgi:hypothetical protein
LKNWHWFACLKDWRLSIRSLLEKLALVLLLERLAAFNPLFYLKTGAGSPA